MDDFHSIQRLLLEHLMDRAIVPQGSDPSLDLIESGILDSLMLVDLVMLIQSVFHVELQAAEVSPEHFRNVACLARLVHTRLQHNQARAA